MSQDENRRKLIDLTATATRYCVALQNAAEHEKEEFVIEMLRLLPELYLGFSTLNPDVFAGVAEFGYFPDYVDEDFYESVRRNVGIVIGEDDVFLETFEEDMKYSDTPIAASVSECLADIFQPLFNFISVMKDAGIEEGEGAYQECHGNFEAYWSQTLCNVMRALNNIRYNSKD